ncbi:GNAT family N-acetyltransferase [Octadecabacter sp. 1_MG-2023]|uniref:GNAT family N-acetyltransferase n=1 Tax=unclassified Octadecabacter TaxID=196158 RepID=UPI001C08AADF|nr:MULTISPECIES: GNAT family N-acetyltransferase [unclassified Octadecabacter]MBU2994285.1 GNAT family N-acetyltransferase [Octadecabacter sp. B2R22]MDO6734426.1 GNAT family N-acetyltransferase [Octadecabacter sp. 1_MG-2023]
MTLPTTITTERLTLRQFEVADLEGYVAYYTGDRTGGVGGPKPRYVVVERFMAMVGQWVLRGYGRYAIDVDGTAIGHVGVMHIDETDPIELTWSLWDAAHEGMGYATEAARAVLSAWAGPKLTVHVMPENARSLRVADRLGYKHDEMVAGPHYAPELMTLRLGAAS